MCRPLLFACFLAFAVPVFDPYHLVRFQCHSQRGIFGKSRSADATWSRFQRGVYPAEDFTAVKKYGLNMLGTSLSPSTVVQQWPHKQPASLTPHVFPVHQCLPTTRRKTKTRRSSRNSTFCW